MQVGLQSHQTSGMVRAVKTADVLKHFDDSTHAVAKALGITRQAVEQWGENVPETSAYKLQVITAGRLQVDQATYTKGRPA